VLKVVHTHFSDYLVDCYAEIRAGSHFQRPALCPSDQVGLVVSPHYQELIYNIRLKIGTVFHCVQEYHFWYSFNSVPIEFSITNSVQLIDDFHN
jgi:hypothetical protein